MESIDGLPPEARFLLRTLHAGRGHGVACPIEANRIGRRGERVEALKKLDREYDERTDHGADVGVRWP